jgi:outer membrane protein OmpA-like peptidoglycan-associated protein
MNPVNWWHRQEGGKIAEDRPAPPGADQPYPNMSTVPARPEPPDQAALKKLTDSLIADRTNAQHAAQAAPLADPSSPSASPTLFGVGSTPPPPPASPSAQSSPAAATAPQDSVASASLPAAPAPPPAPAPRKPVQAAPLQAPAEPPAASASAAAAAPPPNVPQPDLPAGPPPRSSISPPTPAAAAEPPPIPPSAPGISSASIVFVEGSTALSPPAADEVKAFAARRGAGVIVVTGYGDAASSDPSAQSAALTTGLARATAIAETLKADGVPGNAVRVNAEASGRGASLRLLQ